MKKILVSLMIFSSLLASAEPSHQRLQEISSIANSFSRDSLTAGILFRANAKIPGPAWSFALLPFQPVIETNPQIFDTMPVPLQNLVMFHEIGHVRLNHIFGFQKTAAEKKENELEADAFGAVVFAKFHRSEIAELLENLRSLENETLTVPTGPERLKIFRALLR
jgi:predicted metal-dependent peptidase